MAQGSPQPILVFPDFLEEGQSSWHRPASAQSVSKQAAPLVSLEGAGVLRLAEFPQVDSTIVALVSPYGLPGWHFAGTLLQISGFQGQALGRSLASLIAVRRQLWLSQARIPDTDKSAFLDASISPGHTFGPAVEEILQRPHRQVASRLPSRAPVWKRMRCWCPTVTQMVPIATSDRGAPRGIAFRLPRQLITGAARKDREMPDMGPQRIND
ncbi:UNVERIFIED_CONTAM: hypothetical protein FKN15_012173 [Acipenser sinensis]